MLAEQKRRQAVDRRVLGVAYLDQDLVFAHEDGRPAHPDVFSQTFRRAVRRLDLPIIRLHDLRHTHATMGLAAGIPVKIISTRLGHATTAFTQDIYMHKVPALEESAAEQIADLIFKDAETPTDDDGKDDGETDAAAR